LEKVDLVSIGGGPCHASNRLQQGQGICGTLSWTYDGAGNRTAEALSPSYNDTYNYASSNNQLASLTQDGTTIRAFSYDGAGNLISDSNGSATYNYGYNNSGRLATLTVGSTPTASYVYDGLGRLAIRTNQSLSGITQYVYDQAGHLLAESDGSGNTLTEYVWLDDMPIALVADVDTDPILYFVHTDHLNRPIRMTDGGENVVWDAVYNPFGGVNSITGPAANNLRFPGQYFLMEDGLHYNWYRHYDPSIGRYIQPDSLGLTTLLSDGPSVYGYAQQSPLTYVDPRGEATAPFLKYLGAFYRACMLGIKIFTGQPDAPPPPPQPKKIEQPAPRPKLPPAGGPKPPPEPPIDEPPPVRPPFIPPE
jgi:RHS repeat-associated protein